MPGPPLRLKEKEREVYTSRSCIEIQVGERRNEALQHSPYGGALPHRLALAVSAVVALAAAFLVDHAGMAAFRADIADHMDIHSRRGNLIDFAVSRPSIQDIPRPPEPPHPEES
ncbi:MAG: hypothetical protein P8Y68_14355 [Anaerolineales bacterium]